MTETTTPTSLEDQVKGAFDKDSYTPYQMAGVVNKLLEKVGLKTIPAQMIYQYCNKKYIVASRITVTMKKGKTETREGWSVKAEDAVSWTTKYITKNLSK